MRCWLALIVAGCGRIAFAPQGTSDGDAQLADDVIGDGKTGPTTYYAISSDGVGPSELLTIDLAGRTSLVGTIPSGFGVLGGLAYWDSTTLYASTTGAIIQIQLQPFSSVQSRDITGTYSALERNGSANALIGVDQDGDAVGAFDPESTVPPVVRNLGLDALGGDIVQFAGSWYWWSNNTQQLMRVSITADPVPVGFVASMPFIAGIVVDEANGRFVLSSGDADQLYFLSTTTFTLLGSVLIDRDLQSGDMTRTP